MRQEIPRTLDQYSLRHNLRNDSEPRPCSHLQSEQALLWTLRNSSWTSRPIKPLTTKQPKTSMTQTQGGQSWLMASPNMTVGSMSRTPETYGLEYYNTSMTALSWDISVKTKPWHQSEINTHGPDFGTSSLSFVSPVEPVCVPNHSATAPMACSNNYQYWYNPGIRYQWIS